MNFGRAVNSPSSALFKMIYTIFCNCKSVYCFDFYFNFKTPGVLNTRAGLLERWIMSHTLINHFSNYSVVSFVNAYPLHSDLSGG